MKRVALAWFVFAAFVATAALAQPAFPTRTVKLIVPFHGGGINDVLARIVGDKLQVKWGQPVVVENKTGAGGNVGATAAYQSEPDGTTLLLSPPGPLAINQSLYKQLPYKPQEFVPLAVVGAVPNAVIVRKELPVNSLKELIAYVKANPGKVSFGTQGNGATPHLTAMMFQGMTDTRMVHVPYRGETLVLNDMMGGHVDVFFGNIAAARALFREGRVKIVAVCDSHRAPALPEIPTTGEAGLPGLVSTGWFALAAPPKLSPALQSEIASAAIAVITMPDVQEKFRAVGVEPVGNGPPRRLPSSRRRHSAGARSSARTASSSIERRGRCAQPRSALLHPVKNPSTLFRRCIERRCWELRCALAVAGTQACGPRRR